MYNEDLTQEEIALLNTEFPAEIEKIASAQISTMDCMEALREFGESKAEIELLTAAGDEEGVEIALEKQATASTIIEDSMKSIRALNYDSERDLEEEELGDVLTKEAAAAGQVISDGYFAVYNWAAEECPELLKEARAKAKDVKKAGEGLMSRIKGYHSKHYGDLKNITSGAAKKADDAAIKKQVGKDLKGVPKDVRDSEVAKLQSMSKRDRLKKGMMSAGKLVAPGAGAAAVGGGAGYGGYRAIKD